MGHFSKAYEPQGEHWLWVEVLAAALVGSGTDRLIELPWWKPEVDGNSVPFYLAALIILLTLRVQQIIMLPNT